MLCIFKHKKSIILIVFLFLFIKSNSQTIYYSKSSGNLNTLGTWGLNANGSGASPTSFTAANCTYIITNTTSATIGAAWVVSGASSKVQVGNGSAVTFSIPSAFALTGTVNVSNTATLTIQNTTIPTIGTLASGSTVNYANASNQTVTNAAYYNLTLSGGGQKSLANTINTSITNFLTINNGVTFRLNTVNTLTCTISGTVTGAGGIIGNANANLIVNGSGNVGTLTFSTTLSLYQFSVNVSSSGNVKLGSNLTVSNAFTHNNGIIDLNGKILTLNDAIAFPTAASNGAFTGSSTSSLSIGSSTAAIANSLFMDQTSSATKSLGALTFNRSGKTLTLGNDLIVSGGFTQTNGPINLNGKSLSLNGAITFPAAASNGSFTGSSTSILSIGGSGVITNSLFMSQSTSASKTINSFTYNRTGVTLNLGNDLICDGQFNHTNGGISSGTTLLTLTGAITWPVAASNGSITGSTTSSLTIGGSGTITNALFMSQTSSSAKTFNNFSYNRTGVSCKIGNALIATNYTQTNGTIDLNGTSLTLNGAITFPAAASNGSFTGSSTSSLSIGSSTATMSNPLFMNQTSATTKALDAFTLNRSGQTLTLGNDLIVSGGFTQTNGSINLNGKSLTLNGAISFPVAASNGSFTGSSTSTLSIGGSGSITNSMIMSQSTSASKTINSFTYNRAGATLTLGNDLICDGQFNHTNGGISAGTTLLTLTGAITWPVAASNGSITGSATSSLTIGGSGSITNALFMSQASATARTFNNFSYNRTGVSCKIGNALIATNYTQTNGTIDLNGTSLTLNGAITFPAAASNGSFTGSSTSSLSIGSSTATMSNPLFMNQTSATTKALGAFTLNRSGQTLTLGNDLIVSGGFTQTNGPINLNGKSLTLNGVITFPAAASNGSFTGSSTSTLSIGGTGAITNSLILNQSTAANKTINSFTYNRTGGIILSLANDLICDGQFNHTNGGISAGTTLLTLTGAITWPVAASNGSITGSATSSLTIGGSGSITNALFMSQASAAARTFNNFSYNRTGVSCKIGNALIATNYTQTNGTIDLNGTSLTLNGAITFPAAASNGSFTGSSTSSLSIGSSTATMSNPLFMNQTSATTKALGAFTLNRSGQTLTLGNDLIVSSGFTQTNGPINLNGKSLSLNGAITFPTAASNGSFTGSSTSTLSIGGTGAITNSLFMSQSTSASKTINSFTYNRTGVTLSLGNDLICDGQFNHTNGTISAGTTLLTLTGAITWPVAAGNGSITGSSTSSLTIGGSGSITNALFMSQSVTTDRTFNNFSYNRAGITCKIGNPLIATNYTQTNGTIDLNGTLLTLNGAVTFPAAASNGSFTGSSTSSLSIGSSTATMSNPLFMDQTSVTTKALGAFTLNRSGQTLTLGNDLIVSGGFTQNNGPININGKSLTLNGAITFPAAASNGSFTGSSTSTLSIGGSGAIANSLFMTQSTSANKTINSFTYNRTGVTLSLGNDLICDGQFNHTNGGISAGATSLALTGAITWPAAASNGSITGSATSSLAIGGSGAITNALFMSQASATARTFNNFSYNRTGITCKIGNPLIATNYTQTNGTIDLNSTSLTLNGVITFPAAIANGSFIGSTTSSVSIGGAGAITNSFLMDQSNSSNLSLYDLTLNRAGQTLTIGNALEIRNSITPTAGNLVTGGFVKLKSDATRSGMVGTVGGTISGNITVETYAPSGSTGWVNLGPSGVTGLTVANWENQIYMTCLSCPNNEYSAGGYFVSIERYNEAGVGNAAYVDMSYTDALTRGVGYWLYLGTSTYTTTAITYSVTGPVVSSTVTVPVTVSANAGSNLVSNPYAAPIDWDLVAADAANSNLDGAAYFYNPDLGQTISYSGGVSNPIGYISGGIIPMGQGFYVTATSGGNVTFKETHKSTANTSANPLLRSQQTNSVGNVFRLSILGPNLDYDETAIRFHDSATASYDRLLDARKLFQTPGYLGTSSVYSKYTTISSRIGNSDYSINSIPNVPTNLILPILAKVQTTGSYVISPIDLQNLSPNSCVMLKDNLLNINHDLRTGPYTCTISDTTSTPRFELTICSSSTLSSIKQVNENNNSILISQDGASGVFVKTNFDKNTQSVISAYNVMGQKIIADTEIEGTENTVHLNFKDLHNQVVIIRVTNDKGQVTKKVFIN